jgi:hypothetical protein
MRGPDLLQTLADIGYEHAQPRRAGEKMRVVTALVTGLDTPVALLQESASQLGGVLLDCTSGEFDDAVAGFDDAALRGDVTAALAIHDQGLEVELSHAGGSVDAALREHGNLLTHPTDGQQHFLAVARAVQDARLATNEFAVLLYNETILDYGARAAVLSMLTGLAESQSTLGGGTRTLLVLIRSSGLDISEHCNWPHGVRYCLEDSRLVKRHPPHVLLTRVDHLSRQRQRPLVLFLAAGFSASSGMPVGNALRDNAIRRLTGDINPNLGSDQLADSLFDWAAGRDLLSPLERGIGRERFVTTLALEQVVRMEIEELQERPPRTMRDLKDHHDERLGSGEPFGQAVYALKDVLERHAPLILITVNFDELVEDVAHAHLDIAVTDDEFSAITPIIQAMQAGDEHPGGLTPYLKLHGTISDLDTCIATDDATRSGLSAAKRDALIALTAGLDANNPLRWIYVGASMRDIDLQHNLFGHKEFYEGVQEWWVSPTMVSSVEAYLDAHHRAWRDNGGTLFRRTITETADSFLQQFARKWPQP